MLKLTTSTLAALFSIFGFGYSFFEYTETNNSIHELEEITEVKTQDAPAKLVKSPLIKVNGEKLVNCEKDLKTCALEEVLN